LIAIVDLNWSESYHVIAAWQCQS